MNQLKSPQPGSSSQTNTILKSGEIFRQNIASFPFSENRLPCPLHRLSFYFQSASLLLYLNKLKREFCSAWIKVWRALFYYEIFVFAGLIVGEIPNFVFYLVNCPLEVSIRLKIAVDNSITKSSKPDLT